MDLKKIRQDFPLLQEGSKKIAYFDNACQSLRPRQVVDAINQYYLKFPACGGRSNHSLAAEVTRRCDEARAAVAKFLNAAKKEEIVFGRNTTEGINLVANALDWQKDDVVLISDKEHNSNLIPWQALARKKGVKVRIVPTCADNTFDWQAFENALDGRVKLVSLVHTSNLDGVTFPV